VTRPPLRIALLDGARTQRERLHAIRARSPQISWQPETDSVRT
jgi:hypothetical protein